MSACSSAGGARTRCASGSPCCWAGCRAPRGYRVVAGRDVRISVLSDAGEAGRQPVQIDGDDALTLPVSIGLAAGAVRLLYPV